MTHDQWEAALAATDRWSAYDLMVLILLFAVGLLLVFGGLIVLTVGSTGLAGIMAVAGYTLVTVALNKRPYQAR